jgi:acetyl esterase
VHVLAVEYRLAPEAPYPAALEDALAAFAWACAQAGALGADPACIAVGGDSAGGNLAAVVAQVTARSGGPVPAAQLLLYPVLDRSTERASLGHFAEGFFLTREEISWYQQHYTGGRSPEDPRISPLRAHDLSGLPPAVVVTAGFDPLRDEGEAYAHALAQAGSRVTLRRFDGLIHGFANMGGLSPACRAAVIEVAGMLKATLENRT